jgi:acetate kinase
LNEPIPQEPILVVNAGSSSLKFAIHAGPALQRVARGEVHDLGAAAKLTTTIDAAPAVERSVDAADVGAALGIMIDWIAQALAGVAFIAIGHRIVHGGTRYREPTVLDDAVLRDLEALDPLAPQHQPYNLAAARDLGARFPEALSVACFDTAFHAGWDDSARRLAVPRRFHDAGVRRYGFHGLSCEYLCGLVGGLAPQARRVVIAHLGGGSSISAVRDGRSIESTMGFSVLDGLPMATRSGAIDPGAIFHLHRQHGMDFDQIEHMLYYDSGLKGVSGISGDMRTLLASDRPEAREAIALYAHRCTGAIGAMAATLGGIDALVFSGGIGAHAAPLRATICAPLAFLGLTFDTVANDASAARISAPASKVGVFALQTDEERVIARHCRTLLATRGARRDRH